MELCGPLLPKEKKNKRSFSPSLRRIYLVTLHTLWFNEMIDQVGLTVSSFKLAIIIILTLSHQSLDELKSFVTLVLRNMAYQINLVSALIVLLGICGRRLLKLMICCREG